MPPKYSAGGETGTHLGSALALLQAGNIHLKLTSCAPVSGDTAWYVLADFYAALYVRASIKGFLVRNQVRACLHPFKQDWRANPTSHRLAFILKPTLLPYSVCVTA